MFIPGSSACRPRVVAFSWALLQLPCEAPTRHRKKSCPRWPRRSQHALVGFPEQGPRWGGHTPFSCPCKRTPGITTSSLPLPSTSRGSLLSRVGSSVVCVLTCSGTPGQVQRGAGSGRCPCEGRLSWDSPRDQSLVPPAAVMPPLTPPPDGSRHSVVVAVSLDPSGPVPAERARITPQPPVWALLQPRCFLCGAQAPWRPGGSLHGPSWHSPWFYTSNWTCGCRNLRTWEPRPSLQAAGVGSPSQGC